eukprot:1006816-Pyramimonas_sp.AAC.1
MKLSKFNPSHDQAQVLYAKLGLMEVRASSAYPSSPRGLFRTLRRAQAFAAPTRCEKHLVARRIVHGKDALGSERRGC